MLCRETQPCVRSGSIVEQARLASWPSNIFKDRKHNYKQQGRGGAMLLTVMLSIFEKILLKISAVSSIQGASLHNSPPALFISLIT